MTNYSQSGQTKTVHEIKLKNYFDSREQVFVKLYKTKGKEVLYWETWNIDPTNATTHWGLLGNTGESENVGAKSHLEFRTKINTLIGQKIKEGYTEIPIERQYTLTVTFKLKSSGTTQDLDRREEIRNTLTEHLGWTGNGRCDDGDIGSGEMTLFADVIDPYLAIRTIPKEFKSKNITEEYYFTVLLGDKIIAEKIKPGQD
jgi:hypothetical protein